MLRLKQGLFFSFIVLFLFGFSTMAAGAVLTVPKGHKSIQQGINAAKNGDTVRVAKGHYVENVTLKEGVTLEGGWNANFTKRNIKKMK